MLILSTISEDAPNLISKTGDKNRMRKTFKKQLSMTVITACLMLTLSGMNAYGSGYTAIGHRTDDPNSPPALTTSSTQGGYITSSGRGDGTTQSASTAADSTCLNSQIGTGSRCEAATANDGNILSAIGVFLISIFA